MTDEHDVVALVGEPDRFLVHLGDQRAGGVDHPQVAVLRLGMDRWRHPVCGEHHQGTLRHLIRLVDEDRAPLLQGGHHMLVVHDLLAHVDRCAVLLEGSLDGHHRPVDTGAIAAGGGQQHTADRCGSPDHGRGAPALWGRFRLPAVGADGHTVTGNAAGWWHGIPAVRAAGRRRRRRRVDRPRAEAADRDLDAAGHRDGDAGETVVPAEPTAHRSGLGG